MTCIAWDGKTLAADKQATNNGLRRTTTKIHRVGSSLVAFSGGLDQGMLMLEWVRGGYVRADFPPSQRDKDDWTPVMVIAPDRVVRVYERTPTPMVFEDRCYAMGSGRDYAMAAMHLGCNAIRAVEVACALDVHCGNGIDVLEF